MSQIFNLAIDLAGENFWYDCETHYNSSSYIPIECGSKICPDVACIGCNGPFKPGCTNNIYPANDSPLNGLPKITKGIIGLARSNISLPTQLALKNKLPPMFSLCLPSSNKQGFTNLLVGSIGKDPFQELYKFVQSTPLIVNPVSTGVVSVQGGPSMEYFINVKTIKPESQRS
ncbi:probable aspartic proteinase GIP2 [Cicer arietinum]|uniref:Uncharacterized protein LOC101499467 n=1 Tax=Cicer arietinum TaxID=3827 RepID=A0A3Q7XIQ0_CICAR|nr:uncharacterized protein LOC101499467 [Cicer arietinum]